MISKRKLIQQASRAWKSFRRTPDLVRSTRRLRAVERELLKEKGDLFELPFVFSGYGEFKSIKPKQVLSEIHALYQMVQAEEVRYVCEIGTYRGGTFYLWCQAARDDATLVSIDLPSGPFGGGYSESRINFYRCFGQAGQSLHFLRANSHLPDTVQKVKEILRGNALDFVFIDGDHTYEGVKQDFELYSPLVRRGGIIALHDIRPRTEVPEIQVYRFWQEIKDHYEHQEIIEQEGAMASRIGIGILRLP